MTGPLRIGAALGGLGGLLLWGLRGALLGSGVGALAGWGVTLLALPRPRGSSRGEHGIERHSLDPECRPSSPRRLGGEDDPPRWPAVANAVIDADMARAKRDGRSAGEASGARDARLDRVLRRSGTCYRPSVVSKMVAPYRFERAREAYVAVFGHAYRAGYDKEAAA